MLLKEQGTLQTPVGTFSAKHEAGAEVPEQAQFYKQLIPLSKPGKGEQYAFKVDLDRCTGCKACVSACHSLNGLDEHETWRDVGTIHGVDLSGVSYTQTVTSACHHCADPGCLNGCPVLAYEKDVETGIVRHLDDQCIGCQYCALKCPYDVPKYSKSLGIVRKCDMCHNRLADGEAPACVQACPTEAISITIVNTDSISEQAKLGDGFLPAAPDPSYTIPTTRYVTERSIPDGVQAADLYALRPEHGHLPLVVMLVLTQFSVGLFTYAFFLKDSPAFLPLAVAAVCAMGLGLAASTSHLGRPLGAWRAFLGLRRSWLSREIVAFGIFSQAAAVFALSAFVDFIPPAIVVGSGVATVLLGVFGVFTSVMIYHDTQRPFWAFPISAVKFFGSTLLLGSAGTLAVAAYYGAPIGLPLGLMVGAGMVKLGLEGVLLTRASDAEMTPQRKTAMLMMRPLRVSTFSRFGTAIAALLLAGVLLVEPSGYFVASIVLLLLLTSEILERSLFFRAVSAPKMPGGVY